MLLNKLNRALVIAAVCSLLPMVAMADHDTDVKKKVVKIHDSEIVISENDSVHTFKFEGTPSDADIEEKIANLAPEVQESVRKILKNLHIEKIGESASMVKVISDIDAPHDVEKVIELHADHVFHERGAPQVFAFSFEGGKGDHYQIIKRMLDKAELTPEQIVELQDILLQK